MAESQDTAEEDQDDAAGDDAAGDDAAGADRDTAQDRDTAEADEGRRTVKSRRRGAVLEQAIREAVLTELLEAGYGGLTFDSVAARAHAGKASLYRRWPTREELIMDALRHGLPPAEDGCTDTGSLRDDVLLALHRMNTVMEGPVGRAIAGLIGRRHRYPELAAAVRDHLVLPRREALAEIFRRDAERQGVLLEGDVGELFDVGPAVVLWHHMLHGAPMDDNELEKIVDDVLLPLWEMTLAASHPRGA
ncbi:MAG: hypothetical protein QG608_1412 [Actinomycetota bacterium]|nr:hypothetical protein [Actinomycetota bacterium]